jgi:hypothetical protein
MTVFQQVHLRLIQHDLPVANSLWASTHVRSHGLAEIRYGLATFHWRFGKSAAVLVSG